MQCARRRAEFLLRCPAVLPNGTAVANGTRYVLKSGRGPIQASPDCTTATCRPVLQDMAVLELTTNSSVRGLLRTRSLCRPCAVTVALWTCEVAPASWAGGLFLRQKRQFAAHIFHIPEPQS